MIHILHWTPESGVRYGNEPGELREILDDARGVFWIDFDIPSEEETRLLTEIFHFHPLTVEDCVRDIHHPKIDDFDDYLYIVIHGVRPVDVREHPVQTEELDAYLLKNGLVTYHLEPRRSISGIREKCRQKPQLMARGPDYLLYEISDVLVDNYSPVMNALEAMVSDIERDLFENPDPRLLHDILALRKDATYIRRVLIPQREIINRLSRGEFDLIGEQKRVFFRDVYDHLYRIADQSESLRERMTGALEANLSMTNNRLNEVMKVLAAAATIAIPLTVVTSFWGMNFSRMPLLEHEHGWLWSIGIMSGISLAMLLFFRYKRWI